MTVGPPGRTGCPGRATPADRRTQPVNWRSAAGVPPNGPGSGLQTGIRIVTQGELTDGERSDPSAYSRTGLPGPDPLAVDPAHPFPLVSGLSLNLRRGCPPRGRQPAFRPGEGARTTSTGLSRQRTGGEPDGAPADGGVDRGPAACCSLAWKLLSTMPSGSPRNAPTWTSRTVMRTFFRRWNANSRDAGSALPFASRCPTTCRSMLELLLRELDVDPGDVVQMPGLLDLSGLWQICTVDRPALKDPPFVPATNPAFGETGKVSSPPCAMETFCCTTLRVLLPACNASSKHAAADPIDVLAIKQTLYRTSVIHRSSML